MISVQAFSEMDKILKCCLNNNLPFFAYQLPNSEQINIGIQKDLNLMSYQNIEDLKGKQGFVFAPFDSTSQHPSYFIREDLIYNSNEIDKESIEELKRYKNPSCKYKNDEILEEQSVSDYFVQIADILNVLKTEELEKVILSRVHTERNDDELEASSLFLKLCQAYPKAFVSFVFLPEICSWIGASPELLLKSEKGVTETVALAGTLPILDAALEDLRWGKKEIEEQAFVSDYIERIFKENAIEEFESRGPFTVQAGQVVHLKTEFKIESELRFEDKAKIIKALHPTPAVCGVPKQKALDLIKEVETYDREYYAGYWGTLKKNGDFDLYVNLRTMKITDKQLSLFVGGGITVDSVPRKEWEETQYKAQTLLSVIKK